MVVVHAMVSGQVHMWILRRRPADLGDHKYSWPRASECLTGQRLHVPLMHIYKLTLQVSTSQVSTSICLPQSICLYSPAKVRSHRCTKHMVEQKRKRHCHARHGMRLLDNYAICSSSLVIIIKPAPTWRWQAIHAEIACRNRRDYPVHIFLIDQGMKDIILVSNCSIQWLSMWYKAASSSCITLHVVINAKKKFTKS